MAGHGGAETNIANVKVLLLLLVVFTPVERKVSRSFLTRHAAAWRPLEPWVPAAAPMEPDRTPQPELELGRAPPAMDPANLVPLICWRLSGEQRQTAGRTFALHPHWDGIVRAEHIGTVGAITQECRGDLSWRGDSYFRETARLQPRLPVQKSNILSQPLL